MPTPSISVLLCTVRNDAAFREHPEWTLFEHIKENLERQTYRDFELVLVDGLREHRSFPACNFPVKHIAPMRNRWTQNKKVAISAYRNTGIAQCSGDLIVNMDDTFTLPKEWLSAYMMFYQRGICGVATWRNNGDRRLGINDMLRPANEGEVYGFGSYPRDLALALNGYDLAYDGGMYLEDIDWGIRLHKAGLRQYLFWLDEFRLEPQSGHDDRAIDSKEPIVKCCNAAWQTQRVRRTVIEANRTSLWSDRDWIDSLLAPCRWLRDGKCLHHHLANDCAYLKGQNYTEGGAQKSFAETVHPLCRDLGVEDLTLDLRALAREAHAS